MPIELWVLASGVGVTILVGAAGVWLGWRARSGDIRHLEDELDEATELLRRSRNERERQRLAWGRALMEERDRSGAMAADPATRDKWLRRNFGEPGTETTSGEA